MAWSDLVEQRQPRGGDISVADCAIAGGQRGHPSQAINCASNNVAACFPVHRDLTGCNFVASQVDWVLGHNLADLSFKQDAQNVLHIWWPGTGNTHLVTALEQDKAQAKRGELR